MCFEELSCVVSSGRRLCFGVWGLGLGLFGFVASRTALTLSESGAVLVRKPYNLMPWQWFRAYLDPKSM